MNNVSLQRFARFKVLECNGWRPLSTDEIIKGMKLGTPILSFILCVCFSCKVSAQSLAGKVFDVVNEMPLANASVTLLDQSGKRMDLQKTDTAGTFTFKAVPTGKYSIRLVPLGRRDTLFKNIKSGDTLLNLNYYIYCQYDKSRKDKSCPICRKIDQVILVYYGLPVFDPQNPDKVKVPSLGEVHFAGCEMTGCDAHWYCKRDKESF